ncbi:carbon monoxide dehydrogenase subunit G [Litoreibacter ponti]|uniref:Carbon monoxide dehydrogenase subunit G n=1 Tax=Litoreibacter ponti TaxID=1510457 RepID=A0A2T6BHE2_9RHOB|nr:SRPBCC family protein [Litoreibacter ponti]PTX55474.1 carbon monoxide dehydrogenase subunit G [Litoreibacter ponti]
MQIARSLTVSAPVDHVWSILATDYAKVGEWARAVQSSEPNTAVVPLAGAPVGGRVCTASIGDVTETIRTFDPEAHVLAYDAKAAAMPFFVRNLSGRWKLHGAGGATEVDLSFVADLMPPFGVLMGWAIRRQFSSAIDETLEDLKLFAETGKIHPDKAAALAA